MDLIFFFAVGISVIALTPLGLPLLGMAKGAVRSPGADEVITVASEGRSQLEVERSVRGRLYGERPDPAVTPIPRSTTR